MNQKLNVELGADVGPLESGILRAITRLGQLGKSALQAGVDLAKGINSGTAQATKGLSEADKALGRFIDKAGRLHEANGKFAGMGNSIEGSSKSSGNAILGLVARFYTLDKAFDLLKSSAKTVSDFERLDAALRVVSKSEADYAQSQLLLKNTSDQLGISYQALAESYKGIKAASNGTTLEGKATEKIFLSIVHAGAALKLSNDEVKGSLLAVQQMMSKGTIQAEELRGQLSERLPGAFGALARAMGVTEPQLNKMLETGQVLASDALPKLAAELEKTFGAQAQGNVNTIAGSFTRLTDQTKLFIAEFSKTTGIDSFFARVTNGLADTMRGIRGLVSSKDWSSLVEVGYKLANPYSLLGPGQTKSSLRIQQESRDSEITSAFRSDNIGMRNARLQQTKEDIALLERKLNDRRDTILGGGKEQLQLELKNAKDLLSELTKINQELRRAERQENSKPILPVSFDIDKAKDRQSALAKQIQNYIGNGQAVPASVRKEYDDLTAKIEKATDATKKHKAESNSLDMLLTGSERILKRLTDQYKAHGDTASGSLSQQIRLFKELVELEKKRESSYKQNIKPITNYGDAANALRSVVSPLQGGLLARFGEVNGYGSLAFYYDQIQKIKTQLEKASTKNLDIPQTTLNKLTEYMGKVSEIEKKTQAMMQRAEGQSIVNSILAQTPNEKWNSTAGIGQNWADVAKENLAKNKDSIIASAKDMTNAIQTVLTQGAQGASQSMGLFIGGLLAGTANIKDLPKIILGTVADMLQSLATALAASGAAMILVPGLQGQGIAQLAAATGLFAVAGLARGLAQPKTATAFAVGGTVSGPTYSLTGEYPGASRNPEFISPVNKGANMIAQSLVNMGVVGGGGGQLSVRVSGSDLLFLLDRAQRGKSSLGAY